MDNRDLLNRIAEALEGLRDQRDQRDENDTRSRKRQRDDGDEKVVAQKEYHEIWWSADLTYGRLEKISYNNCNVKSSEPVKTNLYVNGRPVYETVSQVLNRLQGTIVGTSQAAYNGVHTRSWTVETTKKSKI
jgi:hypothetical protein